MSHRVFSGLHFSYRNLIPKQLLQRADGWVIPFPPLSHWKIVGTLCQGSLPGWFAGFTKASVLEALHSFPRGEDGNNWASAHWSEDFLSCDNEPILLWSPDRWMSHAIPLLPGPVLAFSQAGETADSCPATPLSGACQRLFAV